MASAAHTETDVQRLARWERMASAILAKLEEVILLATGPNERACQISLDALAAYARRWRRLLLDDMRRPLLVTDYGSLGDWGPNGLGPAIDDTLANARFHAARSDSLLGLRRAA